MQKRLVLALAAGGVLVTSGFGASAEPLRLRGDALVQTQPQVRAPVGLLVLSGEDRVRPWVDAETVAWVGTTAAPETTGDVLTLSVRMRDAKSGSELRVGRMIVSMGAVRPLHLDGARGLVRVFDATTVETFGGFPVASRFDYRSFDWAAGGRVGQAIGSEAILGASYQQRRNDDRPADEEAGADLTYTPSKHFTVAGRAAFDLWTRGLTDALASASVQNGDLRVEMFTTHRSPSRLLPSTSLFSVLGDYAATSAGTTLRWRAFPRLELLGTTSGQVQGGTTGGQGTARATLALDDGWVGSLGVEARRVDFGKAQWVGARGIATVPIGWNLHASTELELVRLDDEAQPLLPWGLGALSWRSPASPWEAAAAVEASAGRENTSEVHLLARLSYAFERSRP
jgi:hypothetical protein